MEQILEYVFSWGNFFLTLVIFLGLYLVAKGFLNRKGVGTTDWTLISSIIKFFIIAIGLVALILAIPMSAETKNGITSLLGIVISATLAFSSATFIGNALSGIMMRTINNFKLGDFIEVNEHFGRVTERGLFHTEIQKENSDLTTFPNLYLATNPLKVTRSVGTYISAEVSLGYDVNRQKVEKILIDAVKRADLEEPFVHIMSLGDYSIVYRAHGKLKNVKTVISARSRLRAKMLDALHEAKIEIVSPTFMNQRQVNDSVFIPKGKNTKELETTEAESNVFDKAEIAESLEGLKERLASTNAKISELAPKLKAADSDEEKASLQKNMDKLTSIRDRLIDRTNQHVGMIEENK